MMSRMAIPVMALLVAAGCSGPDATAPVRQERGPAASRPAASAGANEGNDDEGNQRSGVLRATKECSHYTGLAGSFCTINSSNLKQLPAGTKIVYAKGAAAGVLETDIVLYPPGGGRSVAFGHISLNIVQSSGVGTLTGGTGKFKHLRGGFEIARVSAPKNWSWTGWYSFGSEDDDD